LVLNSIKFILSFLISKVNISLQKSIFIEQNRNHKKWSKIIDRLHSDKQKLAQFLRFAAGMCKQRFFEYYGFVIKMF